MNGWKKFVAISCLLMFSISIHQHVEAQQNLAQQAYAVFEQHCMNCHGEFGAFADDFVIQHSELINTQAIVPGKPEVSTFYRRLIENTPEKPQMPLGQPPLPLAAIDTVRRWIEAGAPDWDAFPQPESSFITTDAMLDAIHTHLRSLTPFERSFARYFTLTHLYNAGENTEALHAYRRALSKLINSLSWGYEVINPQPIDSAETIFYIDLRHYEWDVGDDKWTQIEAAYPYSIDYKSPIYDVLRQEMNCELPFVHADWFLATASLPPLYYDILDLPQTDRELERRLEVDIVKNLQNAPGVRVWRAGFNESRVSVNNRVLERHTSRYGAYWKSYDFAGNVGFQNVLAHPLSFRHDGGEIIFNLPNGLQAYYLSTAAGSRLDAAPVNIVSDVSARDPVIRTGLSCMGCHTKGLQTFEDQVRSVIKEAQNPPYDKAQALRLYVEKSEMDVLVSADIQRYKVALEATGGIFGGIQPIRQLFRRFEDPLDAVHAAAEAGLETDVFLEKIRENKTLQNLGLRVVGVENGSVKRDAWTSNFSEVITALSSPGNGVVTPVVPQPERIPGSSVHIPDATLRAVVAEALSKAPNATITVEEMATLTHLAAGGMDIEDLEGLQFAVNLEELRLRGNLLSDLSPLAGLTTLREVEISGESLSDLSPLAGLINLEGVGFWKTSISDMSPLAGLTKLRWLEFENSPVSDLSPLAGLTNLRRLETYASKDLDLLPLKGLTSLVNLRVANSGVSDVSSLSGLVNLERLTLEANRRISDISALTSLRSLTWLDLSSNQISDVSPLATLHNLERLQLQRNNISDISSLDGLRGSTEIHWFSNPGFPQGGPKIEGPWLWVLVPGADFWDGVDLLSQASNGAVTEPAVATSGVTEGSPVGEHVWTSYKIEPEGGDNIRVMLNAIDIEIDNNDNVVYGSLTLHSPREQQTQVFAGSDIFHKVWLNGELVHENLSWVWARDYQDFSPATLKQGTNVLLFAVYTSGGQFSGYLGFEPDTEYMVISPGTGFTFSTDTTNVRVGDTFTLRIDAEKVTDLAGWQFDIAFDPDVLEVVEMNEGNFLKIDGGTTFFQKGTIDNTEGKIVGLSSALIAKNGVTGTGTLLSVVFSAKAGGHSQLALHNFQLGSTTGEVIPAGVLPLRIIVEPKPKWDVNADGQVSVLDLILVAQHLGEKVSINSRVDVNRDGIVSILDLILVAQHMGESTASASPSILVMDGIDGLDPAMVQAWIERAQVEDDGSIAFREGIANLQRLLTLLIPEETALLPNYPNPFNPETWIPYELSEPAEVTLCIYAVNGRLVRTLVLGLVPAGIYQSRSRAVYWDGRNDVGEPVSSGVYFYTLTTSNFTATRKMLVRK